MAEKPVMLAAPEEEVDFWILMAELTGLDVQGIRVNDAEGLIAVLSNGTCHPCVLVLSAALAEGDMGGLLLKIKAATDARLIVAATSPDRELERSARAAGIFFYLLLPSEGRCARTAVEKATQAYQAEQRLFGRHLEGQAQ